MQAQPTWESISNDFRILPADRFCELGDFRRFQTLEETQPWMKEPAPVALLFFSHRWEAHDHPDPDSFQFAAAQTFIRQICIAVRATFERRDERLALVPDLDAEGILQAQEISRRILGHGPFARDSLVEDKKAARREIALNLERMSGDEFDRWLMGRIGVWVDYCCLPQLPRSRPENDYFERSLARLDELLSAATVIALRRPGDDYAQRAWCSAEVWLGSERSFARSLSIDMELARAGSAVPRPERPDTSNQLVGTVLNEAYDQDHSALSDALGRWLSEEGSLDYSPPDPWSAYRSLQGSGFHTVESDPNPARRALEVTRALGVEVIARWWLSPDVTSMDLRAAIERALTNAGLKTTDPTDGIYLGLLWLSNGWIEALRPFFRSGMEKFLQNRGSLSVDVTPLRQSQREILTSIEPCSADTWASRLSSTTGLTPEEQQAVAAFNSALIETPLQWRYG